MSPLFQTLVRFSFLISIALSTANLFAAETKPHVVFMIGEKEYKTKETLPVFAKKYLTTRGIRCTFVHADEKDKNHFPGLEAIKTADLLFLSVRRRALSGQQMKLLRQYLKSGKPLVGIRTSCHPFHTRGKHPAGHVEWQKFDPEVLGGNYHNHHGNGPPVKVTQNPDAKSHPILVDVEPVKLVGYGSLYRVQPLATGTQTLLFGTIPGKPTEPIAWTHAYGKSRVFYTSLGQWKDFDNAHFNRLLTNAVFWALDKPFPAKNKR